MHVNYLTPCGLYKELRKRHRYKSTNGFQPMWEEECGGVFACMGLQMGQVRWCNVSGPVLPKPRYLM